jgi:hypothetical protein
MLQLEKKQLPTWQSCFCHILTKSGFFFYRGPFKHNSCKAWFHCQSSFRGEAYFCIFANQKQELPATGMLFV